jgi:subtilisin family serine protease
MRKSKGRVLAIAMAVILVMVMSVLVGLAPPVMSGYGNTMDESNFALRNTDTTKEEWLPLRNDSSKEANWSYTKPIVPFDWNASSEELIPVIILLNTDAFGLGTGRGGSRGRIKRDLRIIDAISADVPLSRMDKLNNSKAVKAIYPDRKVHALLANSVPLIHASDVWQLQDSEGNNVTGKGVLVAVLDTGVNYSHPDLGGGFGPEYKVVGGYDFVNEDDDPMDDNGHGTLVSGIVAASGNLKGVAPDANLLAYKVLDNSGSGYESDVIAGMEKAIEDGAAIMSMSFGFSGSSILLSLGINYAIVHGVIVVAAAGNDGPGFGTINSPASYESVIAVGDTIDESILEVQTLEKFDQNASQLSENKKFESLPMKFSPHTSVTGEIAYAGLGYPENFSSSNTTFTGKIALIKRGILTFEMKVKNAFNAGATGAIIFNNQSGYLRGTLVNKSEIPAVSILDEEGKYLLDLLNLSNEPVIVNLTIKESIWMESSRGPPCTDYTVKPDLVAPGCWINTTAKDGKYVGNIIISGTSFSAPHVSGACVLLLQLHPDWTLGMIKAALMNNAKDIGYGVFEQGAGRVDVLKAATPEFIVTPPSIGFYVMGSTSSNKNKKIKVENLQNYTIPVNVSVVREQGMYLNFTHINLNSSSFDNIKINVTPDFTLHPKENEQIDFTITVPENYTAGYYCGKIVMKSDNSSISIPFALTLDKSSWIFKDDFSTIQCAVSNAEAKKQLEHWYPRAITLRM